MNTVFEKYKNIHEGKRVFLIANGPSLAYTNLDLIKDELSIAMNKVSLIYPKNELWRPTYYMFSSTYFFIAIRSINSISKLIPYLSMIVNTIVVI